MLIVYGSLSVTSLTVLVGISTPQRRLTDADFEERFGVYFSFIHVGPK